MCYIRNPSFFGLISNKGIRIMRKNALDMFCICRLISLWFFVVFILLCSFTKEFNDFVSHGSRKWSSLMDVFLPNSTSRQKQNKKKRKHMWINEDVDLLLRHVCKKRSLKSDLRNNLDAIQSKKQSTDNDKVNN